MTEVPRISKWSQFNTADERSIDSFFQLRPGLMRELADLIGIADGMFVVDVGCGGGDHLMHWCQAFPGLRGLGLDMDPAMTARARRVAQDLELAARLDFRTADAYRLPQLDEGIDLTLCKSLLSNLHRPDEALVQMRELVKPSGRVVAIEPVYGSLFFVPLPRLDELAHRMYDGTRRLLGVGERGENRFNALALPSLFDRVGLSQIRIEAHTQLIWLGDPELDPADVRFYLEAKTKLAESHRERDLALARKAGLTLAEAEEMVDAGIRFNRGLLENPEELSTCWNLELNTGLVVSGAR